MTQSCRSRFRVICRALVVATGTCTMLWVILAPDAHAIPYFARKYETACSTCHNNFPELNDFGEAFKKNGWKFPKDEETYVKQPPVLLGAPAQRQVFPKAIYPGELPGTIPISFRYSGALTYNNKQPIALGFQPRTDLFAPNTFTIIAAGTFGDTLSFWVDDDLSAGGSGADGGLGDGYLKFNDLGHYIGLPKNTLNLKLGQFELDLPFSQARTINPTDYDIYDQPTPSSPGAINNPFVFGATQRGFEIGGYPNNGNFTWSFSLLNGSNDSVPLRDGKDVYVRVSQKFNLERDPAVRNDVRAAGPTGPRDHTSIRVGGFYYYGNNAINVDHTLSAFGTVHEPFYRVGGDLRFKFRNLEVYGLLMHGRDRNLIPDEETGFLLRGAPITFTGGFTEAEYWIYPWLVAIMRYDAVNSPADFQTGVISRFTTRNRFSPGLQVMIRGNIKTFLEFQRRWEQPSGTEDAFFRPNSFLAGIDYAF